MRNPAKPGTLAVRLIRCLPLLCLAIFASRLDGAPPPDDAQVRAAWQWLSQRQESFRFSVDSPLFGRIGEMSYDTRPGDGRLLIASSTKTRGLLRWLYRLDMTGETEIDPACGRVLSNRYAGNERGKPKSGLTLFDYPGGRIQADEVEPAAKGQSYPLVDGCRLDLVGALFEARLMDLQPGAKALLPIFFEDRVHQLVISTDGVEELSTPWGKISAARLAPSMSNNPSSFFRRGGRMNLWVSNDERRLPLLIELRTGRGGGKAKLVSFTQRIVGESIASP